MPIDSWRTWDKWWENKVGNLLTEKWLPDHLTPVSCSSGRAHGSSSGLVSSIKATVENAGWISPLFPSEATLPAETEHLKNCLTTFHLLQGSQNLHIFITYEWAHYLCDFLLLSQPCSGFVWKSPQYSYWFQAFLPPAREPWSVTNKEVLIEMWVQSKYSPYRSVCEKYDKDKEQKKLKLNRSNFPLKKSFY